MKRPVWWCGLRTRTLLSLTGLLLLAAVPVVAQEQPATSEPAPPAQPVPQIDPAAAQQQLEAAYQKEYAFLQAQLRDLQARSAEFDAESRRDETARQAQIEQTEADWIGKQSQAETIQSRITEAQRELESVDDARITLEATFLQADSSLEPYNFAELKSEAFLAAADGERIAILFGHAVELLARVGTLYEQAGVFFLPDGTEVQGRIIRLGNVAAYGISDTGSGALAPAGEGRLKVWSKAAESTATALGAGQVPEVLGMFLFETETKAIEEKAGKTIVGTLNDGGSIAWIIVGLGLFGMLLVVMRFIFLRRATAATGKIVEYVGGLVRQGRIQEALDACKQFKGATARVIAAAVRNLERDRAHLEDIISEAILHESAHLNRFGSIILVIATVSPLLGLLGTVTGMITTFDIITEFGTGDPKMLSGGIAIALITTEVGLAVAIPALLAGNILSSWAESIKDDMEKGALRVINQFKEHRRTA